jgi:hypothetical protein
MREESFITMPDGITGRDLFFLTTLPTGSAPTVLSTAPPQGRRP